MNDSLKSSGGGGGFLGSTGATGSSLTMTLHTQEIETLREKHSQELDSLMEIHQKDMQQMQKKLQRKMQEVQDSIPVRRTTLFCALLDLLLKQCFLLKQILDAK